MLQSKGHNNRLSHKLNLQGLSVVLTKGEGENIRVTNQVPDEIPRTIASQIQLAPRTEPPCVTDGATSSARVNGNFSRQKKQDRVGGQITWS